MTDCAPSGGSGNGLRNAVGALRSPSMRAAGPAKLRGKYALHLMNLVRHSSSRCAAVRGYSCARTTRSSDDW